MFHSQISQSRKVLPTQRWEFHPAASPWIWGKPAVSLSPPVPRAAPTRPNPSSSQLAVPSRTHPRAKTSECLEKGSLSSSVSGESCRMISGAR